MLVAPVIELKGVKYLHPFTRRELSGRELEVGVHFYFSWSKNASEKLANLNDGAFNTGRMAGRTGWMEFSVTGNSAQVRHRGADEVVEEHAHLASRYNEYYEHLNVPVKEWESADKRFSVGFSAYKDKMYVEVCARDLYDNHNRPLVESMVFVLKKGEPFTPELKDGLLALRVDSYRKMFELSGTNLDNKGAKGVFDVLVEKWGLKGGLQLGKARTPEKKEEHARGR